MNIQLRGSYTHSFFCAVLALESVVWEEKVEREVCEDDFGINEFESNFCEDFNDRGKIALLSISLISNSLH